MEFINSALELEFIIKNVSFDVAFEEGYFDHDEETEILDFISAMSKEMCIDKSYVECYGNKRKSTFLVEDGWNTLKDVILDSEYCKYLGQGANESLVEAFSTIARCYIYDCVSSITDKFQHIMITINPNCVFDVIICKDVSHDWKKYAGKWQDWEFDDEGKPIITKK